MYPHVHALDVERALDLVPTPAGTTAERERVLRRQGVPFGEKQDWVYYCLLYTSPSPRDQRGSRMPSSA